MRLYSAELSGLVQLGVGDKYAIAKESFLVHGRTHSPGQHRTVVKQRRKWAPSASMLTHRGGVQRRTRRVRSVIDQRIASVGAIACCQAQRAGPRNR